MYCTKCGVELRESDNFCSRCGAGTAVGRQHGDYRPLLLDKRNKKVAGVCAGFAHYLGVDVTLVRVLTLALAICTCIGFLAYIAAWIVIPADYGYDTRQFVTHAPQTM